MTDAGRLLQDRSNVEILRAQIEAARALAEAVERVVRDLGQYLEIDDESMALLRSLRSALQAFNEAVGKRNA